MRTLTPRRHGPLISAVVITLLAAMTATASATVTSISTPDPGEEELSNPAVVRTTLTAGGDPSMQLDALGNPVVAYTDYVDGAGGLRLLRCDDPACSGSGETISMLDQQADGNHTSMQLDGEGNPVIAYKGTTGPNSSPGDLRLVRCNDPACAGGDDPVTVLVDDGVKRFAQLRLDADGNPVVLFRTLDYGNFDVADMNLIHCDDPLCVDGGDVVSKLGFFEHKANGRASLELDPDGLPVIVYSGQWDGLNGASSMTLVQCNDVNCAGDDETETFVGEDLTHADVELVVSGDDYEIVIAAVKFNFTAQPRQWKFGLHMSRCLASACEFEHFTFPDSLVDSPHTISLSMSSSGPVIAYPRDRTLRLASLDLDNPAGFYALRDAVSMAPDPAADGAIKPSFVLDADDKAVVAYLADGGLKVVRCNNAGCIPTCNGLPLTLDFAAGDPGSPRADVIRGTAGNDVIDGGGGNDVICGLGGDDNIVGGDGADKIFAGAGNDTIDGGTGNDRLVGGVGNDVLDGEGANDRLIGGPGNDTLTGGWGNDRLSGGAGHDLLSGNQGSDTIFGNLGRDRLAGGSGDDILRGGAWVDVVDGGDGNDDRCGTVPGETRINCERGVFGL